MDEFTKFQNDSINQKYIGFSSSIDKKGRAILNSYIRKLLRLKYSSQITVKIDNSSFNTKVDERGRFVVPKKIRKNSIQVSGIVKRGGK